MADAADQVKHYQVQSNGISMHVAEQGPATAPPVLMLHGFPELWLSWRHQMAALAAAGYRAIAPDLRGYGDTEAPSDPKAYTLFHIIGDLIGLLDHLQLEKVFVVGHDWGAMVAWHFCLLRPDRVIALVTMGVPFFPRSASRAPTESFKARGEGFYITQFQEPGRAEKSFARYDIPTIFKKFYCIEIDELIAPAGMEIIDFLQVPAELPPWITEEEIRQFADKFQKTGFTGPLNYYRMMDTNWSLLAPWQGAKISVPTKYIVGSKDIGFRCYGTEAYIKSGELKKNVPNLEVVIVDGAHHFIQQEQPERVTSELLSYFAKFASPES